MTGVHNGPIGLIKKEVVRVVFRTHEDENYYLLDEEVRKEYDNKPPEDVITHKDLKKIYEDKLKNGEAVVVQNEKNIREFRALINADVKSVVITNYSNK